MAKTGDQREQKDDAHDPFFREGPAEDPRDEVFDLTDKGGDQAEREHPANRSIKSAVWRCAEDHGGGGGEQCGLQELDRSLLDRCRSTIWQPCGEQNGNRARTDEHGPDEDPCP